MKDYTITTPIGKTIDAEFIQFSDGTSNIQLHLELNQFYGNEFTIVVSCIPTKGFDQVLWDVLLIRSAIKNAFNNRPNLKIKLWLNYLPHARADRCFNVGNATPLEVFSSVIDTQFDDVSVVVPHNSLAIPASWTVVEDEIYDILLNHLTPTDVVVYPDAGALTRFSRTGQLVGRDYISLKKTRDQKTGQVNGMAILKDTTEDTKTKLVIFDDICDGGRTFIEAAILLKAKYPETPIELVITHGIFSKGLDVFKGHIDTIRVHQLVCGYVTMEQIQAYNQEQANVQ